MIVKMTTAEIDQTTSLSNPFQFATDWTVDERGSPVTTNEN